jgi:hypothetical protein
MRPRCLCLGLSLAAASCRDAPPPTVASPQAAEPTDAKADANENPFPPGDRAWVLADYQRMHAALVELEQSDPSRLPRFDGPDAAVFARLTSLENAGEVFASLVTVEELLALGDALAGIMKLYTVRVAGGVGYGREYVAISVVYLHVAALQLDALPGRMRLTTAGLRADRVRLEGFAKARYGVRLTLASFLISPIEHPELVGADDLAKHLAPIVAEVAPFLLPEELPSVRAQIEQLAKAGAAAPTIDALSAAFDDAKPRHPLVAELLAEHRAFTTEQDAILQKTLDSALAAIELEAEGEGTRFAFPDRTITAVFDARPNAVQTRTDEGGAVTVSRTLGLRDAIGFARSVTCITRRPSKLERGFAKQVLDKMKAERVTSVEVSGHEGLEGSVADDSTEALVRVVDLGGTGCVVVAEYPAKIAATVKQRARAFVDSVRLATPPEK